MGIWNILKRNLGLGSRTQTPQQVVPHPDTYRGQLVHDTSRCTACRTCSYVCSPAAITFDDTNDQAVVWQYYAGQCTYCGRCAAYCPTHALVFEPHSVVISGNLMDYHTDHAIAYSDCSRCGKKFIALPGSVLLSLYGDPLPADIAVTRFMCEECRNKVASRNLKEAVRGQLARRASDHIDRLDLHKTEEKITR